jgi:hypothetical protein
VANKRESSNQKRQRANRAQREALAARTEAASTPRPSRQPPKAVRRTGGEVKERRVDANTPAAAAKGSKQATSGGARPKRERRPRLGDSPVDLETLEGSWFKKVMQVPGGSQVLMGFGITAVTAVFLSQAKLFAQANTPKNVKKPKLTRTLFDVVGTPQGLLLLAIPIVLAGFALLVTLRPWRRRAWTGAALAFALLVLVGGALYFNFIFSGGFLAYALFRASKVEGPAESLFAGRRRRGRATTDADVDATDNDGGGTEDHG